MSYFVQKLHELAIEQGKGIDEIMQSVNDAALAVGKSREEMAQAVYLAIRAYAPVTFTPDFTRLREQWRREYERT